MNKKPSFNRHQMVQMKVELTKGEHSMSYLHIVSSTFVNTAHEGAFCGLLHVRLKRVDQLNGSIHQFLSSLLFLPQEFIRSFWISLLVTYIA